jgi:hypothetical protein
VVSTIGTAGWVQLGCCSGLAPTAYFTGLWVCGAPCVVGGVASTISGGRGGGGWVCGRGVVNAIPGHGALRGELWLVARLKKRPASILRQLHAC